eukprot:68710-Amphidinium_carterae.1
MKQVRYSINVVSFALFFGPFLVKVHWFHKQEVEGMTAKAIQLQSPPKSSLAAGLQTPLFQPECLRAFAVCEYACSVHLTMH